MGSEVLFRVISGGSAMLCGSALVQHSVTVQHVGVEVSLRVVWTGLAVLRGTG